VDADPAPVDDIHLLALLTRVRQERVDAGPSKRRCTTCAPTSAYSPCSRTCVGCTKRATGGTIVER